MAEWTHDPSNQEHLTMRSGSVRNELREVLQELSFRKNSAKDNSLMSTVRRRFNFTVYTILLLLPIWFLLGTSIYFIHPKITRLWTLQDALEAYRLSQDTRAIGEALTEEWLASHRYLIRPGAKERTQLYAAFNRTDELIQESKYLSRCLSLPILPVTSKEHLQKYLWLFREDQHKRVLDVSAFYDGIVDHIYSCSTEFITRIEVQQDWSEHVCYQQMLLAELHLSKLKCMLPLECDLSNDTFRADEVLTLANIASSKLNLAKYFLGDELWWMKDESFMHSVFSRESNTPFCYEIKDFSDVLYNRTKLLTERHTNYGLEHLFGIYDNLYKEIIFFITVGCISFLIGTIPVPIWMLKSSTDIRFLSEKIREVSRRMIDENDRANSVVCKIIPVKYAPCVRQKNATSGPQSYDSVTVLYLSIPDLKKLNDVCSPSVLINILTFVFTLVEERISLYDAHILQRAGFTYCVASGMNAQHGSRHVTDIANMALDLLIACSDLELAVIPDSRVQLRIGINTGPCVGTVPKQRTLRYCLVGRTVEMAARLEETSQLGAIHLSKTTAEMLESQGCYRLVKTGGVMMLDEDAVESYWLMGRRVSCQPLELSDRRGSSFSTQSHQGKIELAMKPLYRYDSEENTYLPLSYPPTWPRNKGKRRGQAASGFDHSLVLQGSVGSGLYNADYMERHDHYPHVLDEHDSSEHGDTLVNTFCDGYPSEKRLSDNLNRQSQSDTSD